MNNLTIKNIPKLLNGKLKKYKMSINVEKNEEMDTVIAMI